MKTTTANLFIEVKYALYETHNAPNCDLEIDCEECGEKFIVSDISF